MWSHVHEGTAEINYPAVFYTSCWKLYPDIFVVRKHFVGLTMSMLSGYKVNPSFWCDLGLVVPVCEEASECYKDNWAQPEMTWRTQPITDQIPEVCAGATVINHPGQEEANRRVQLTWQFHPAPAVTVQQMRDDGYNWD
ncbi:hypothetical protein SARC_02989 [Sphaeroforma arctica JP610]|uniref:Uncharacterized protein n=1 Tax=Sphaeroforma arctica JP610 TaxID=667725 RepID=A0A0L0G7B6_9EUKA|nr:hypothetical protein SARC_02989 [Sphaeroforma arctica JP610]KNC84814.1 hypothetical protein SARC_02989 [Sphaeroforma arctica JP610]|eukprot:XP_014158716.1 hypothetical protein SARC_02989 [Sphaeroforma arctica JP610]